jgi:adenylate cyclase
MARRLAAVLSADVVGYSRLMGADEAGTLAAIKKHRKELIEPKARQYDGRTVKLMGDGALMEFASAVDAVSFAVEVQCAMAKRNEGVPKNRQIVYRIGINIGDIIIEGDDIFGDGVNIAARLEGLAEPGSVCISRNVFDQIKGKLDLNFEDLGEKEVKNIADPVFVYRVLLDVKATGLVTDIQEDAASWYGLRRYVAVGLALLLIAGTIIWRQPWAPAVGPELVEEASLALPDKPSIAVLPFTNMSDDKAQEYFSDGVTEDLITDLSKISGLFVVARNSTFSYKGRAMDVRQVAKDLGVRYVLEGSIRKAGEKVRINAQLIDATTGGHIWADRYDGGLQDVFALQDAVTEKIVGALAINLTESEKIKRARQFTTNVHAYDAFLQGWNYYQRFSADDFVKAIPFFEKAIQLDPNYGRAYAALASLYWETHRQGETWTSKVTADEDNYVSFIVSRVKANEYLKLARKHPSPLSHRVASAMSLDYRQFNDAIAEAEQAVTLDPNDPDGHVALAWALIFSGRPQEALTELDRVMRLDPQNPEAYMYVLGWARFGLNQYQDAVTALQRAYERRPEYLDVNVPLAAAYSHLGRLEEGQIALKRYTYIWRAWATNVDGVMSWWPFKHEVDVRRLGDGLVKAGLCCEELLEKYIERVRLGGTLE